MSGYSLPILSRCLCVSSHRRGAEWNAAQCHVSTGEARHRSMAGGGQVNQLPKDRAIETIASVIEELPSEQWTPSDSKAIAARLVELLPSVNHSHTLSANPEEGIRTIVVMGLILTFLWGAALTFVGNGERQPGLNVPDIPLVNVISPQRASLRGGD